MKKDITIFNNSEFGQVRVINHNNEPGSEASPWFVAKDVATALGYTNPKKAVRDHCKQYKPIGGNESFPLDSQTNIIPESDVYRLIMRSKLPSAEKFQDWVVEEILPTIRKTGGYVQQNREEEFIENYFPSFSPELQKGMVLELQRLNKTLESENAQLKQLTKENLTVGRYAELHLKNYFSHGQKVRLGKMATKICQEKGWKIQKEDRTVETYFGSIVPVTINTYPKQALDLAAELVI